MCPANKSVKILPVWCPGGQFLCISSFNLDALHEILAARTRCDGALASKTLFVTVLNEPALSQAFCGE